MSSGRSAFLRGAFAMGAALLVAFTAHNLFPLATYPPARIQSLLVAVVPGDFATMMIERLGHVAMRALAVLIHLGALLAGGVVARWIGRPPDLSARGRRLLVSGAGLFVSSMLLNLGTIGSTALTAAVVYAASAILFLKLASDTPVLAALGDSEGGDGSSTEAAVPSRRRFVFTLAWIATGLAVAGAVFKSLMSRGSVAIAPAPKPWRPPLADPNFPAVGGLASEITSNEDFYNVDIDVVKPVVDHNRWRLDVRGLVDKPFALTYDSLQSEFEVVEMAHTLTCVSNEVGGDLVSTAVWRGVRLADVLAKAGLRPGIVDIVFRAAEGYSDSIPLEKALEPTTLLVFGMNGVALPKEHGFPVRVIVPGIYGMKNVKWVTEIEAVSTDYQGYWMVRGWSDSAIVKTQSRIDVPLDGALIPAGARVAGVAWAGDRGVERVEVSYDRGVTWRPARLERELAPLAWRRWVADLPVAKGRRRVMVRAVDKRGEIQTARSTPPHPDGAAGHDLVDLTLE